MRDNFVGCFIWKLLSIQLFIKNEAVINMINEHLLIYELRYYLYVSLIYNQWIYNLNDDSMWYYSHFCVMTNFDLTHDISKSKSPTDRS